MLIITNSHECSANKKNLANIIQYTYLGFLGWDFFKWTSFLISLKIVILTIRMPAANSHYFHHKMFILVTGLQTGLPPEAHNKNENTLLDMWVR